MEKDKKNLNLDEKNRIFQEKIEEMKKELDCNIQVNLDFPEYKILPDDLQLSLSVISKHKIDFNLSLKENK